MSDLLQLTDGRMEPLQPFFPESHGKPRVGDRRVSGIVFVNTNGLAGEMHPSPKVRTRRSVARMLPLMVAAHIGRVQPISAPSRLAVDHFVSEPRVERLRPGADRAAAEESADVLVALAAAEDQHASLAERLERARSRDGRRNRGPRIARGRLAKAAVKPHRQSDA